MSRQAFEAPVRGGKDVQRAGQDESGGLDDVGAGDEGEEPGAPGSYRFSDDTAAFCDAVGCAFRQAVQVERVMADAKVTRMSAGDPVMALERLAAAFVGEAFDRADLDAFFEVTAPTEDEAIAQLARELSALHALLDPAQRERLAALVGQVGPYRLLRSGARRPSGPAMGAGRPVKPPRGTGPGGGPSGALRPIDAICEVSACTDAQRASLLAALDAVERPDLDVEIASMNLRLAVQLRAERAPPEAIERQIRVLRQVWGGQVARREALMLALHRELTPEQRAALAEHVRAEGVAAGLGLVPAE